MPLILMPLRVIQYSSPGRQVVAADTRGPGMVIGAGVAFPVVVLSALLLWSTWQSAALTAQSSLQSLKIAVGGHMWWWSVRYPNPAGGPDIVTANEIHIPAGEPVYLGLTGVDVIHSFWVPALAGKRDMIPGQVNGLTLKADRPGIYRGQCAEYCGQQHARMALHVVAHTPAGFAAWLARQAQPARVPGDPVLLRGMQVFIAQRCVSCHTVRGVADGGALGPDLTHFGSRMYLAAGTLRNHRPAIAGWVADPQSIKPGARMPAAGNLSGADLRALTAWLDSLE